MKNGSFEFKKNNYLEENNKDIIYQKNHKRRANSNISIYSGLDIFNDKNDVKNENINNRNQSHITSLLSLKQTEKEDIIKGFNDYNKKIMQNKNSSKKKNLNMKTINNNSKRKNKPNKKVPTSNKIKLKNKYSNYNTERVSSKSNSLNKTINKANNFKIKNIKLNTFNNENKQKFRININCINNNSLSKFDSIRKSNKFNSTNNENRISTNTNSYNKNINIITFGSTQSKNIPSEFVYIKKNNICYSNSNLNKSKNKSHFNNNSFLNALSENNFQRAINDTSISEFRFDDNKENDDENIHDIMEEENINKINISYIGKYKTIGQIEKKIESENMIKRIINNNLKKKINNMKHRQDNKEILLYNEGDIETNVLNTATFGSLETEKKY